MHEFKYKADRLYCENLKIEDLARQFGTPLYVYSKKTILDHFLKLKKAFRVINPLICFSVKANSNLSILKILVKQGAGLDIVSGGELFRSLKTACPADKIVYASVGKTTEEIKTAIKAGILFFNVESLPELENINKVSKSLGKKAKVAIRLNPDVTAKTHKFITTGKITNKFGIDLDTAYNILLCRNDFIWLDISGLHIHIGSQITEPGPFIDALTRIVCFLGLLKEKGIRLEYLNIGGGLGIVYRNEVPQTAGDFAGRVLPLLKKTGLKVILEPGRFIVGNAGILVVKVLYVKRSLKKTFVIVDGAMNDLIRPALYGARHKILSLYKDSNTRVKSERYDIVGPICESGDFLAKGVVMPQVKEGDYLAVMSCGAYGFSMSSNYNSRLRSAEVMVDKNKVSMIRKRETYKDIIRNEIMI